METLRVLQLRSDPNSLVFNGLVKIHERADPINESGRDTDGSALIYSKSASMGWPITDIRIRWKSCIMISCIGCR
ncbi:hypothetical protein CY34DRAFT_803496 [Suillus luteus UH-Slu-Lm8-n1]|uniref:Uncharacterized protein n=1 Tax=Suillus luteus UH-Slu-Lm8-n1 TaxID=930992 RepID=A0A0D0A1C9_9AGAM|nr:hypothetical protein CY34DRAFT_803496 [Suillus luteus UH-Slu-Lm8-n1]